MENPIEMDDLGVPLFLETSTYVYKKIYIYIFFFLAGQQHANMHILGSNHRRSAFIYSSSDQTLTVEFTYGG